MCSFRAIEIAPDFYGPPNISKYIFGAIVGYQNVAARKIWKTDLNQLPENSLRNRIVCDRPFVNLLLRLVGRLAWMRSTPARL
jgi:hypothetical protein